MPEIRLLMVLPLREPAPWVISGNPELVHTTREPREEVEEGADAS